MVKKPTIIDHLQLVNEEGSLDLSAAYDHGLVFVDVVGDWDYFPGVLSDLLLTHIFTRIACTGRPVEQRLKIGGSNVFRGIPMAWAVADEREGCSVENPGNNFQGCEAEGWQSETARSRSCYLSQIVCIWQITVGIFTVPEKMRGNSLACFLGSVKLGFFPENLNGQIED